VIAFAQAKWSFHTYQWGWLVVLSQKCEIRNFPFEMVACLRDWRWPSVANLALYFQESTQNKVVQPSWISQKACSWTILQCCHAWFQMNDPLGMVSILMRSYWAMLGAYFPFHILDQRDSWLVSQLYHSLAIMALFATFGSDNPRTPWSLGLHNF